MKVLLHICCAPCAIYCLNALRSESFRVLGFFYNHNIHPYQEYVRRRDTLKTYADQVDLKVIYQDEYDLETFLQNVVFRETDRCSYCYHSRLKYAAIVARRGKFDYFTTTLLYSKFQKHDLIRSIGENIAAEQGVPFLYRDFRKGWKQGIRISKELKMYRQQYCGCIYSEKDRYWKKPLPH
ncbi:MAG: epoxyqueuosine reductase QueH [Desulfobacteria bacterium]